MSTLVPANPPETRATPNEVAGTGLDTVAAALRFGSSAILIGRELQRVYWKWKSERKSRAAAGRENFLFISRPITRLHSLYLLAMHSPLRKGHRAGSTQRGRPAGARPGDRQGWSTSTEGRPIDSESATSLDTASGAPDSRPLQSPEQYEVDPEEEDRKPAHGEQEGTITAAEADDVRETGDGEETTPTVVEPPVDHGTLHSPGETGISLVRGRTRSADAPDPLTTCPHAADPRRDSLDQVESVRAALIAANILSLGSEQDWETRPPGIDPRRVDIPDLRCKCVIQAVDYSSEVCSL